MAQWFGSSWSDVGWIVVSTGATYVSLVVAVRLAGRRTLAQISAYDVVVTIALGSLTASTAAQDEPTYAEGMAAIVTLLALQVLFGVLRQRSPRARKLIDFPVIPVVEHGTVDVRTAPWTAQLTEDDLRSRLRQKGVWNVDDVVEALLEPTGQVSIRRR